MKRAIGLLLSVLLLLGGCQSSKQVATNYIRAGVFTHSPHGQTAFQDMLLVYPDPDRVLAESKTLLASIGQDDLKKEHIAFFEKLAAAYGQIISAASLAYVRYCQNVTDESRAKEYSKLNGAVSQIQHNLIEVELALMEKYGYHGERGEAYVSALKSIARQNDPNILALRTEEDALCRQYEQLDQTFSVNHGGRRWTMEDLMSDETLSFHEFLELLDEYSTGRNRLAGELFIRLMKLRQSMATTLNYPTYEALQYESFGRDYSPQVALKAAQVVKQVFVPLYARMREDCENDLRYLSGASFQEDTFLGTMSKALERALPGAEEAWNYMLCYGLYDSVPSEKKLHGSFTTYIASYECPFIFTQWDGSASSLFTMIHEFGHFLSYYQNASGTYYGGENLDLAETDAQGLELMMGEEYEALFGRHKSAARLCLLMNAVYAILSGFMEDEFQQRAYAMALPTVDKLNTLYGELAKEYGFDELFGYEGREWTEIHHSFQFPFYYISYGVSMLGAIALWQKGASAYEKLLRRKPNTSFKEAIGLDVLAEENIRQAAIWIENIYSKWSNEP